MTILSHGSDLSLAPTVGPLVRQAGLGTVKAAVAATADAGCEAIQLDATLSGIRPRDLDERARRDLLALLGRRGLRLAGWDLFIPRKHWLEATHLDRAMTAALAAIGLAADTGRVPLSLPLPFDRMDGDAKSTLIEVADGHGVRLAIHAEDRIDRLDEWLQALDQPMIGAGLDPAALLARGEDPAVWVHRLARRLTVARLSDLADAPPAPDQVASSPATSAHSRCAVGEGDLALEDYRVAVDLASARTGPVVLDLRHTPHPLRAMRAAQQAWSQAAFGTSS